MKYTYLLLALFSGLLFTNCNRDDDDAIPENSTPSGPIELLNNGFDRSDGGLPADWYAFDGPYSSAYGTDEALVGAAVSLTSNISDSDEFAYWVQSTDENIQVNRTLKLSVDIKLENVEGEGVSIVIRGDDTPVPQDYAELFATTQGTIAITGTHHWKTYNVTLEEPITPDIQSITVYMVMLPNTSGTAYFDEVQLEYE